MLAKYKLEMESKKLTEMDHGHLCKPLEVKMDLSKFSGPVKVVDTALDYQKVWNYARQFRVGLTEYYQLQGGLMEADKVFTLNLNPAAHTPDYETGISKLAWKMVAKMLAPKDKVYRVGVMGTSVMAGQDNCYPYSYAPTFQRNLGRLLGQIGKEAGLDFLVFFQNKTLTRSLGVSVNVINQGQNGDGNDPNVRMMCGMDTLTEPGKALDLLQMGWWMICKLWGGDVS